MSVRSATAVPVTGVGASSAGGGTTGTPLPGGGLPLYVTADVRTADGVRAPSGDRQLAPAPGLPTWQPGAADRIGRGVRDHKVAASSLAAAGTVGAVFAARALGRGRVLQATAGIAGALLGATGGGLLLDRVTKPDTAVPGTRGAPRPDAAAPSPVIRHAERLKVMTYNVRGGIGPTGFRATGADMDNLAAAIAREHPDIVVLQEVDRFAPRSSWSDNLNGLSDRLHPDSAVETPEFNNITGRTQSAAILTFHGVRVAAARGLVHPDPLGDSLAHRAVGFLPLVSNALDDVGVHALDDSLGKLPQYQAHGAIDAIVMTPAGNDIRVVGTHERWPGSDGDFPTLHTLPLARELQAWSGPTILGGDFNAGSAQKAGRKETAWFAAAGLTDTQTASGHAPGTRERTMQVPADRTDMDRIYASTAHFHTVETHVADDPHPASDHWAVVATIDAVPTAPSTVA